MFSGRHPIKKLDSGEYFIDRAPHIFGLVLEYLRNGCRIAQIEDNFIRQSFHMELDYWGIEPMRNEKIS